LNIFNKIENIRKKKPYIKIGLCHGVFDLIHHGHLEYFEESKKICDILIVSLTVDKYVNKGPGRPYFTLNQRKKILEELKIIDFVIPSQFQTSVEIIKKIKPDFYFKGPDYKFSKNDISKNILSEIKAIETVGGKFISTSGKTYSSSKLINNNLNIFTEDQKRIIKIIKDKHSFLDIVNFFEKIKKTNTLVIGETIIDQYFFCEALGKSGKDAVLSIKKNRQEIYLGGSIPITYNLGSFCKKINLLSFLGKKKEYFDLIKKPKPKNVANHFIFKENSPTIVKSRFVDEVSNFKLLGVYNYNDKSLNKSENKKLNKIYKKLEKNSDIVIVADYGHGLINKEFADIISNKKNKLFLNAQLNAGNIGHHSLQKYNFCHCIVINETELRHELRDKESKIEYLIKNFSKNKKFKNIILTRGKDGSICYQSQTNEFTYCPAFAVNPVDKVGAGDTLLSIFSIFFYVSKCPLLSLFIASLAAAENVKNFANSFKIESKNLLKILEHVLK